MTERPWDSLREDVHVSPDVTDRVMAKLGYRPVSRRAMLWRRGLHVGTCLSVIGLSIAGAAWVIDLGWRSGPVRGTTVDSTGWKAVGESLQPLRLIVEELDAPLPDETPDEVSPPTWLAARAPLVEA